MTPTLNISLTAREKQILQLKATGLSDKGVGQKLGISSRTVENHTANLRMKFQVEQTWMVVPIAVKYKLIEENST